MKSTPICEAESFQAYLRFLKHQLFSSCQGSDGRPRSRAPTIARGSINASGTASSVVPAFRYTRVLNVRWTESMSTEPSQSFPHMKQSTGGKPPIEARCQYARAGT